MKVISEYLTSGIKVDPSDISKFTKEVFPDDKEEGLITEDELEVFMIQQPVMGRRRII